MKHSKRERTQHLLAVIVSRWKLARYPSSQSHVNWLDKTADEVLADINAMYERLEGV